MTHQLFTCPTHPSLRQLYLGAKVSEITALCLDHLLHETPPASPSLRQRDIDNLQMAKSILKQELESPPSLDELAKRVGMNEVTPNSCTTSDVFTLPVYAEDRSMMI